jgi:hypothetical protein
MRNGMVAVLLVIVIALSAGAGYLVGLNVSRNQTSRSTTTTLTSTSASFTCTAVGQAIGVRLRVVESTFPNGTVFPVSGAIVNGAWVIYCNGQRQPTEFGPFHTNSTEWVDLSYGGGGYYYLNVSLPSSPLVIPFSIPTEPGVATYATVNLSTGNVTTHFCGFEEHCPT